ncbi:MAG: LytTR family transcriptional regulator DNA-binding domain-containing protein [Proteobacteria bacterium]|nr:LytTR family transcriptional regulator DNA-binding domain-containing protein [Pseudomonadota bacterium]
MRRGVPEMAGLVAIAALFLTLSEAFGLDVLPVLPRLLYWLVLLASGQLLGTVFWRLTEQMPLAASHPYLMASLNCLALSLPWTVIAWAVTAYTLDQPLRWARLPGFFLPVLVVAGAMAALNAMRNRQPVETHAASPSAARPAIFARFPAKLRGAALHAVQAEDHYIRLHTSAGSDLMLLRFSDAMAELDGIEGAQIHRSWWVARDAVAGASREDGRLVLVLPGNLRAPVSRSFARALRAKGWF